MTTKFETRIARLAEIVRVRRSRLHVRVIPADDPAAEARVIEAMNADGSALPFDHWIFVRR